MQYITALPVAPDIRLGHGRLRHPDIRQQQFAVALGITMREACPTTRHDNILMSTGPIFSLARYLRALSGHGARELLGLEERQENIQLVAPLGFFVALLFSFFNLLLTPFHLLGWIEMACSIGLLLPALMLSRQTRYLQWAEHLIMLCGLLVFGALVTLGGIAGTGLYWAFTFPFLAFFIKGQRKGWGWAIGFLLLISLLLIALRGHPLAYPYDPAQIPHFLSSLLFLTVMASCFNLLRSRFQEKLHNAVQHNTATAQAYLDELQYRAMHDDVTGLPNRIRLDDIMAAEVALAKAQGYSLVCISVRLHRLSETTNIIGAERSDELMRQLSQIIAEELGEHGFLGRPGHEELLIAYRLQTTMVSSDRILGRLRRTDFSFQIGGFPVHVEFTGGVAIYPAHADDAGSLIRKAEQSMLRAKHNNIDICIYEPEQEKQFVQYHYRFGRLRDALNKNELVLYYQPLINLRTGQVCGVEALARWFDPVDGFVSPDQFIPIAESSGLIKHLTRWSLHEAMQACQNWQNTLPGVGVAINLSPRILRDPELPATLMDALLESGISAPLVKLEITESTLLDNPDKAMAIMREIISMGMRLTIDDYGTGFSSLSYLKHLPAHELKIDQSFVRQLTTETGNLAIVNSTIDLAHNLGLLVVAEGIENEEIMQQLWLLGCDIGQGYYFGKPMRVEDFLLWAQRHQFTPPDKAIAN